MGNLTQEDKQEIAEMIGVAVNTLRAPEAAVGNFEPNNTPVVAEPAKLTLTPVQPAPSASQEVTNNEQAAEPHTPVCTPDQVREILNDSRLEVRVQKKYPLVSALEAAFQAPAASAVINGKQQPLISLEQMQIIVAELKKTGKYWPQVVTTILNAEGERMYVNTSYKRVDGSKWKLGSTIQARK